MTNFAVRGMTAVSKKCAGGDRGLERESWKTRAKTTLEQIERVSRGSLIVTWHSGHGGNVFHQ
jgi:hypothetical protein